MTFEEKLLMYRQNYGLERRDAEGASSRQVPEQAGGPNWGASTDLEQDPNSPDWGQEEDPYLMTEGDERIFGDDEIDQQNYQELLQNDPAVQSFAPQMEGLLKELETQMLDPKNPMTQAEAEQTFVEQMEKNFGAKFRGY